MYLPCISQVWLFGRYSTRGLTMRQTGYGPDGTEWWSTRPRDVPMGGKTPRRSCDECDAGHACGKCLMLLPANECPANPDLPNNCDTPMAIGELCEADPVGGPAAVCGTDNYADNCGYFDVYRSAPPLPLAL